MSEHGTRVDMTGHAPPQQSAGRARTTLLISSLAFFLITLDILIVNLALTSIRNELGGSTSSQQWVIDSYTLMFAALLLFAGNLSDRLGAKKSLGWGIALFLLASLACAAAPTIAVLIGARACQGAAAAVMLPASMALIRQAFPDPRRRAHALGIWAVGGAVAGVVAPLVGGLLTTVNWRLVFAINLPVCAAMLLLLAAVASPFDWASQTVSITALTALMYGLITGGTEGFGSPPVVASLVVAAGGIAGFLMLQGRVRHPMMPLDLFRSTSMRISLAVGFAFMVSHFGTVFVVSLYLQQHLGMSQHAGLVFLPSAAFSIAGNIVSGRLSNRFGPRVPIVFGLTSMGVGLTSLLITAPLGSPVIVGACLVLTGGGGAMAMPQVTAVVLASVPSDKAGTASAVFNTFRQVGGAVAIAVFGGFLAHNSSIVPGMQLSLITAATLILSTAFASLLIRMPKEP